MTVNGNKFHLTDQGPKPCAATTRVCPLGGDHFSTMELAREAFESKHKLHEVKSLSKQTSPDTLQVTLVPLAKGRYMGAYVEESFLTPYLERMRELVGEERFQAMERFKANRDRGRHYHLTVTSPQETRKDTWERLGGSTGAVHALGLGKAVEGENEAWFLVCRSPELDEVRDALGLPAKDFHVTLGFMNKDVHTQPKDESSLV